MNRVPATSVVRSTPPARGRGWLWLHLLIAWLPVWALYTTLLVSAHNESFGRSALAGAHAIFAAALLGFVVQRLTERYPWPRPLRPAFLGVHTIAASLFAGAWVILTSALDSLVRGRFVIIAPAGILPFVVLGVWLYVMVAGISYAVLATERAARAEALAASTQLAALRAQLNPHFLFNALHTVVLLIPDQPARAALAAEQVASLLRTVIEEDRDLLPLSAEVAFIERYLAVEHLRFGDRLQVQLDIAPQLADSRVPSFALQTLVENAVRHAASPRVAPTRITVTARVDGRSVQLTVADSGAGMSPSPERRGTGLARLAERLEALFGSAASLAVASPPTGGFVATIALPLHTESDD